MELTTACYFVIEIINNIQPTIILFKNVFSSTTQLPVANIPASLAATMYTQVI